MQRGLRGAVRAHVSSSSPLKTFPPPLSLRHDFGTVRKRMGGRIREACFWDARGGARVAHNTSAENKMRPSLLAELFGRMDPTHVAISTFGVEHWHPRRTVPVDACPSPGTRVQCKLHTSYNFCNLRFFVAINLSRLPTVATSKLTASGV